MGEDARTPPERQASVEHAWECVQREAELLRVSVEDLQRAIDRRSPTILSTAAQSITGSGIRLTRLLGRIEEERGDL